MTFSPSKMRVAGLLLFFAIALISSGARSAPKSFAEADAAWRKGMLEESRALYETALEEGGLIPREVVVAYSRIGIVKAALRESHAALSDFRVAVAIDPNFKLPADSGPIAEKLHVQASKEATERGGEALAIALGTPTDVPAAQSFIVSTSIPEGFAVLVAEVVVTIEDPVTGRKWRRRKPAEEEASFSFPERVAINGGRLRVRAGAVDPNGNEWAVAVAEIKVGAARELSPLESGNIHSFSGRSQQSPKRSLAQRPVPWIVAGGVVVLGSIVAVFASVPQRVEVGSPSWQ